MPAKTDFPAVFEELRKILQPFAPKLTVKTDTADVYYLDGPYSEKWGKELYFGSVNIQKNYVSFYFMPVYMYPDLLDNVSPELKKHMQGKSCFNFKQVEPALVRELKALVTKGYNRFKKEAYAE